MSRPLLNGELLDEAIFGGVLLLLLLLSGSSVGSGKDKKPLLSSPCIFANRSRRVVFLRYHRT
jgi:hypothetical protein